MMSKQREEAVWRRVLAASEQVASEPPKQEDFTAEQVMTLLQAKLQDACTYGTLAARTKGDVRRCLLRLAGEERSHAGKLEAVYYLMTGSRPCCDRPKAPCVACTNEELRKRYKLEVEAAQKYKCLAEKAGSFAGVFHCLHRDEQRHAAMILNLLEQCL